MLTISKPLSAGQAQSYHAKEFTAKEQNYWSQRGEIAGEWQGRIAGHFGLAGAVSAEDFAKLSQGQHPETGEQFVRQRAAYKYQNADGKSVKTMEHRAGWDATFSAPKSYRLPRWWAAMTTCAMAHRDSVRVALEQLEHTRRPASAEIMHRKRRPNSSLPSSNMTPPVRSMAMLRRNFIPMRSSSMSLNATTASPAPSSRRAFSLRSNLPRPSISRN